MTTAITENVSCIYVDLPNNPLKNTNAYFIRSDTRNLLIDTGENCPESRRALLLGLEDLHASMDNTDIFLTHFHFDHIGLVPELVSKNTRVFMSREDCRRLENVLKLDAEDDPASFAKQSGMPEELISRYRERRNRAYEGLKNVAITPVEAGELLEYGGLQLRVLMTPGHTPGHACLYDARARMLFTGDHVLYSITPNICSWSGVADSLEDYMKSLKKIRELPVNYVLPAHRGIGFDLSERVDALLEHHRCRLAETMDVLRTMNGATAFEVAGEMSWHIRQAGGWQDFLPQHQYFAVQETSAHLQHLACRRQLDCRESDGILHYFV